MSGVGLALWVVPASVAYRFLLFWITWDAMDWDVRATAGRPRSPTGTRPDFFGSFFTLGAALRPLRSTTPPEISEMTRNRIARRLTTAAALALAAVVSLPFVARARALAGAPAMTLESVVTADGVRWYRQALPAGHDPAGGPYPVVFLFHGGGGSALQAAEKYELVEQAVERGFIAIAPEGTGVLGGPPLFALQTWNAGDCCGLAEENGVDDVAFFDAMWWKLVLQAGADPERVFVTGMSNGGMMSLRLAAERPNLVTAAAPVAASYQLEAQPAGPVPILSVFGLLDTAVPFEGGVGTGSSDVFKNSQVDSLLPFLTANGGGLPIPSIALDNATFFASPGGPGGAVTYYYLALDGGHTWPPFEASAATPNEPVHATPVTPLILDFFELVAAD